MNKLLGTICVLGLLFLTGCTQRASVVSPSAAKDIMSALTYAKDSKGLCYAVVASRHPFDTDQNGFTITWVPCSPEVEAAIKGE